EYRDPSLPGRGPRLLQPVAPELRCRRRCRRQGAHRRPAGQAQIADRLPGAQSGLMPADLTTFAHFSVSSSMSLPKSAGELAIAMAPKSASLVLILGSTSAALISLLSRSMISTGVFLGAPTPRILLAS